MEKIRNMPIYEYLKQIDAKTKQSVFKLIEKMEEGSGMKQSDMELVVNQLDQDSISIVSLTINQHLRHS